MADVIAVFAHPDDETFICGGTLAKLTAAGKSVSLVCATKGEMGRRVGVPPTATRETLPNLREAELTAACKALALTDLIFMGYRDKSLEIQPLEKLIDDIYTILLREQPEAVITFHERLGGHPDHCTIGRAATKAFERYRSSGENTSEGPSLLFVAWPGMASNPSSYGIRPGTIVEVDVQSSLPAKLQAFRAHKTQSDLNGWLWQKDTRAIQRLSAKEYFIKEYGSGRPIV